MSRMVKAPNLSQIKQPENNGLLCITLNPHETLVISDTIAIRAGKKGNHMVMRISAPKDLKVKRISDVSSESKEVTDENSSTDDQGT